MTRELIGRRGDSWVCIVNVIDENGIREGRERKRERETERAQVAAGIAGGVIRSKGCDQKGVI